MKALIFGASGGLATAIARSFLARDWQVDLVTRRAKYDKVTHNFENEIKGSCARVFSVDSKYSSFTADGAYRAYVFTQALFSCRSLAAKSAADIAHEVEVGLVEVIQLIRELLVRHPCDSAQRRDFCLIGSTSSYAGFRNTAVYCAVKHGLLGFVRAMNDEYVHTDARFWLFSMGTMNTEMGRQLTEQDSSSFLQPEEVAERIVEAICSPSNIFEPEVVLRRRTIRFLEK